MGGAFTAVADDVSTTYWNTAGLAQLEYAEINLLHMSYFQSTDYEFAGLALPVRPGSVLGLSTFLDFVPAFNSTNNPSATPGSANDVAVALGYGQSLGSHFSFGIGAKYINSNLVTYTASGEALDAGVLLYTTSKDWMFGLSAQNLGQISSFSQNASQQKLPFDYRAGLAYRFHPEKPTHFLIGLDLEKPMDNGAVLHSGGELWFGSKTLSAALRAGYSFNSFNQDLGGMTGASLGAGLRYAGIEFDYAYVPFGILGETQRFSLTYRFGTETQKNAAFIKTEQSVEVQPQFEDLKTGSLKQATFELKPTARTDIKNWILDITDPRGNIIRSYSGKGVPPKQIAWDGKDNFGNTVAGGIYADYHFRTEDIQGRRSMASESIFKSAHVSNQQVLPSASAFSPVEAPAYNAPTLSPGLKPTGSPGVLKIPSLPFSEKSDRLIPGGPDYLNQVVKLIRKYPNSKVYVEGHAYGEGSEIEALRLSQNRADTVLRYLVEKGGISPDNLYSRGHGDSAPLDATGAGWTVFKNRRVDIVIITK